MNKTAHSRTRTDYHPPISSIHTKNAAFAAIRVKTTPSQPNQKINLTTRKHIQSQSCFQQAHLITLSSSKQHNTQRNGLKREESGDQSVKYILERIIGKGAFGVVYKAHSNTQHHLAIKKVQVKEGRRNRQLAMLRSIDHPNLLKIIDHQYTVDNNTQYLHLVTHYYSHTLKNIIQLTRPSLFPLYLYQILKGLAYLEQKGILHRDLTPSNILVQMSTNKVVICDFGSAKANTNSPHSLSDVVARAYRAPELVFGSINYSNQVDMWAFGCIAVELLTGRALFQSQSTIEHMLQIVKLLGTPTQKQMCEMNPDFSLREFESLPKIRKRAFKDVINSTNLELVDLLTKIFVYTPRKRLSATEALKHPYFTCLQTNYYYQQNNLNPEQLQIQMSQDLEKKVQIAISSIKLQSNHKRLISSISKLSESTVDQSTIRKSKGMVLGKVDGIARKLFV